MAAVDYIISKIDDLKKTELHDFMIAYESLDPKLHGFLQALPQKVKIWYKNLPDEDLAKVKQKYEVSQWKTNDGKDSGLFFEIKIPFLGIDGALAQARLEGTETLSIGHEFVTLGDMSVVKTTIVTNRGTAQGSAVIQRNDRKAQSDAIEIAVSNSIRKALSYLGYGRFATEETPYGGNALVKSFREFTKGQKNDKTTQGQGT